MSKSQPATLLLVGALVATSCGASDNDTKQAPRTDVQKATAVVAQAAAPNTTPTQQIAKKRRPKPLTTKTATGLAIFCPPAEKLIKKELFWGAPGGWRSYAQSFVKNIQNFAGAQWVGVKVGKMMCVYKGKEEFTFPVVLQNDTLTPSPTGANWAAKKGGYVNCVSKDITDCPFRPPETEKNLEEVYDDIDFFKGKADPLKGKTP